MTTRLDDLSDDFRMLSVSRSHGGDNASGIATIWLIGVGCAADRGGMPWWPQDFAR